MAIGVFILTLVAIGFVVDRLFLVRFSRWVDSVDSSQLEIDQGFVFPAAFPPDPGPAGRKTIEGMDSDADGVRDDVQRWIYARFPKDQEKQWALRQYARMDMTVGTDWHGTPSQCPESEITWQLKRRNGLESWSDECCILLRSAHEERQ